MRDLFPIKRRTEKSHDKDKKCHISLSDHLLPLGIGLGVFFWIIESAIHAFIFHTSTFSEQIFTPDAHEVWMRCVVVALFTLFSAYAHVIINERKRAEKELNKYRCHLENLVKERTAQLTEANANLKGEIIERERAEKATKVAYTELDLIFNAASDGMCLIDKDFTLLRINDALCSILGRDRNEVVGENCYKLFRHSLCNTEECPLSHILTGEQQFEYDIELERSDGVKIPCILTATPLRGLDGELIGMVELFKDITERKIMEEESRRNQKLESIGILAGGIAHDFNNLLTTITGNISLGKLYIQSGKDGLRVLTNAEKACQQATNLTQQLLTFSKGGKPVRKNVPVSRLLKNTANLALSGSNVSYKLSFPDDLWWGEIDEVQIGQVISNLLINADQAMPDGGRIEIYAENVIVRAKEGLPLKDGRYIKISIKDQGIGIPKEHKQKIFDPYFTTKQKGSGLGLAIAYSIIKKHGGCITLESKIEVGATFSVYLPASEEGASIVEDAGEERFFSGKGKILFMDDQRGVRDMVGETLTSIGYEVYFASEGSEAIDLYERAKEAGKAFDAVILDLTVPGGMGGKETIEKLLEIDPEVKAIVSSGYSNDPIMAEHRQYGFSGVIVKPFNIRELSKLLDEIL